MFLDKLLYLGTLSLSSLAYGQFKSKGPARRPMNVADESTEGLIGGFGDEPIAVPAFEMGKGPGFMNKGKVGKVAEYMQIDRLEGVKLRISEIKDIASVKVSLVPTAENTFTLF